MRGLKHLFGVLWHGTDDTQQRNTLAHPDGTLIEALGVTPSAAGISVTPESAMRLSAVSACVRIIAESIASLPLHVYRRLPDGRRQRVTDLPVVRLLAHEPNELMSSFVFRETLAAQVLLWGNAYAPILRRAGDPIELLPVASKDVQVRLSRTLGLFYDVVMPDGSVRAFNQADMLHVPGLSWNGLLGLSVIRHAAQSIGLGLAAEQFGASFFGNSAAPSGYISIPGALGDEEIKALRTSWYAAYGGIANANRTAVLFEGGKFERVTIPPDEAQFVETRKFQVSEIARWYRVPPHMIGDLERATFSNIEHQALEFVTHTLRPWLVRFEQELNRKLFPTSSSGLPSEYYCEFNVDGLLRGDVKSRADYYVKGRQWGWLSANDVRGKENMEPIDGGDTYLVPLNMADGAKKSTEPDDDEPAAGTSSSTSNEA